MVEIPNQLNSLLRECRTATDIYERLRQKRCLSKPGEEHRAAAVASIDQGEAEWRREVDDPGACGGTREWYVIEALTRGGYLNDRARKLAKSLVTKAKPWWRCWS
jgi:hypothetical protein